MSKQTEINISSKKSSYTSFPSSHKIGLLEGRIVTQAKNQPSKGWYALAIVIGILVITMSVLSLLGLQNLYDFSWICPGILGGVSLITWASCKIAKIDFFEKQKISHLTSVSVEEKARLQDDFSMDNNPDEREELPNYTNQPTIKLQKESISNTEKAAIFNQWFKPLLTIPDKKTIQVYPEKYQANVASIPLGTYVMVTLGKWQSKGEKVEFKPDDAYDSSFLIFKSQDDQLFFSKKMTAAQMKGLIDKLSLQIAT